ncbi:MAG: cob(I)yrinic acid a,c-diamide adenosyltransferase [Streptosporangiales bacterium]|nr:cob(I)yrinic acid a,c-diamide adenosyltransferase [Streptosporangiales bacterium]
MARDDDKPVVLSQIYTRVGDDGTTALGDMSRTSKTDPRIAAYADVEEANAAIGVALALGSLPPEIVSLLRRVQNDLFDVGADLSHPIPPGEAPKGLRVDVSYVERLEAACDEWNATLRTLRSFILPGGTPGAALLHVARTVTRRAERSAWVAIEAYGDGVNVVAAKYLNRLSDLLFILGRVANDSDDVLWRPGAEWDV